MERLVGHYQQLLERAGGAVEQRVSEVAAAECSGRSASAGAAE